MTYYPFLVAAVLFVAGLYGAVSSRSYIHLAICLMVTQSSTYVALVGVGYVRAAAPPIATGQPPGTVFVDPVVQALTLTDIVVSVAVVALITSLAARTHERMGTVDPDKMREMKG